MNRTIQEQSGTMRKPAIYRIQMKWGGVWLDWSSAVHMVGVRKAMARGKRKFPKARGWQVLKKAGKRWKKVNL